MAEPSILGALRDPQFRSDTLRNLVEALNGAKRSLTVGSLGAAGDMGNTLANLVRAGAGTAYHETTGRPIPQALEYRDPARDFGTSASLGNFAERQGWLPPQTYSMPEQAGALLGPIVAMKAPDLAQSTLRGLVSALKSEPSRRMVEGLVDGMGARPKIFAGEGAQTADMQALAKAQQLEKAGTPERAIWSDTGWFRGADKKWRFEIDDSGARFNPSTVNGGIVENALTVGAPGVNAGPTVGPGISNFLHHPALYEAYGDALPRNTFLGNKNTLFGDGVQGAFDAAADSVTLNAPVQPRDGRSTLLHELQHAVQQREGFAKGGGVDSMAGEIGQAKYDLSEIAAKMERMQNAASDEARIMMDSKNPETQGFVSNAVQKWMKQFGEQSPSNPYGITPQQAVQYELIERDKVFESISKSRSAVEKTARMEPHDAYRRLAGEAEARAVQSRMDMTPEQRRATFPFDSYDVPRDKLILRDLLKGPAEATQFPQDAALATAHRNGVDMLGLPENHTPMDRARALGFDMNEYHGTGAGEFAAFDPQKMRDNVQYGGSIYTTKDPNFASRIADSKWSGDQPTVMPLLIRGGKRFDMDAPISAVDAAGIIREAGQSARADKIAEIGKPYRNGSELFYFGIDPGMSNPARGAAINRAGFDVITGDPSVEIMGVPGKPQTAIFDPSRIRSRFAAFDPARRNESDLLASFAGAGILSPLVLEQLADPRDKKDKPRK